MNMPCSVIRDLLPLYAEDLTSEETKELVAEHLDGCPDCRRQLEAMKTPAVPAPDGAEALRAVKKDIRRRRWQAATLAALLVFLPLLAAFAYSTAQIPVPYEEGLVAVESEENGVLTLSLDGRVSGVRSTLVEDPDSGEKTLLLQAWTSRNRQGELLQERGSYTVDPIPDRVMYGDGSRNDEQKLLYGEAMNGGAVLLPRLVLAYYALIALGAALVIGLLWLLLRKKKAAAALRALCFAALSYPIGHLLIKGLQFRSFFVPSDLNFILAAAAAVWGLLMLGTHILRQKRAERE